METKTKPASRGPLRPPPSKPTRSAKKGKPKGLGKSLDEAVRNAKKSAAKAHDEKIIKARNQSVAKDRAMSSYPGWATKAYEAEGVYSGVGNEDIAHYLLTIVELSMRMHYSKAGAEVEAVKLAITHGRFNDTMVAITAEHLSFCSDAITLVEIHRRHHES